LVDSGTFGFGLVDGVIASAMALGPVSNVFTGFTVKIDVVVNKSAP